jgi:excisionase family DNA binding protein
MPGKEEKRTRSGGEVGNETVRAVTAVLRDLAGSLLESKRQEGEKAGFSLAQALELGLPLTLKQAAEYLQISERTVLRYIQAEGFPVHKMTRELRFFRDELDRWLRARGGEG